MNNLGEWIKARLLIRVLAVLASSAIPACGGEEPSAPIDTRAISIDEVGVLAQMGVSSTTPSDAAVFRRPLDAAFVGDTVYVLDSSPPWVRIFDRTGSYLGSMMLYGSGPAEARSVFSLSANARGEAVVAHSRGVEIVSRNGRSVRSAARDSFWPRAAVDACGGIVSLGRTVGPVEEPALLMLADDSSRWTDTLAVLEPMRPRSQFPRVHASYLVSTDRGVLVYPEEAGAGPGRVVEIRCDGSFRRVISVDSIGLGQIIGQPPVGERAPGRIAVSSAEPPFAGGFAPVGPTLLWATLDARSRPHGAVDSVTVVSMFEEGERRGDVVLEGWFQLLDGNDRGELLVVAADELQPRVLILDGHEVIRAVRRSDKGPP